MIHEEIFENLDKVIDYLNGQGWTLSKTYFGNAGYEVMDYGNGRMVYYPIPFGTPLFRGQNEFHEPCVSSFYRSKPDSITEFIQELKIQEFRIITSKLPEIKEQIEAGIYYDYVALAQHYEFKTQMLDVTNSLPVAAFFAVTQKVNDKYLPIIESDKQGVLYFIKPENQFLPIPLENRPEIFPVGWQIFKRPGEQRAFGIKLSKYQDLNTMSGVFAYRFWHNKEISEKLFEIFHSGNDLFPKDIFAEKAAKINHCMIFCQEAFANAFENLTTSYTKETLTRELSKRNISIQKNSVFEFSEDEIMLFKELAISGKLAENRFATTRLCYM